MSLRHSPAQPAAFRHGLALHILSLPLLRLPPTGEAQEKPRHFRLFLLNRYVGLHWTAEWAVREGFQKEKPLERSPEGVKKLCKQGLGEQGSRQRGELTQ